MLQRNRVFLVTLMMFLASACQPVISPTADDHALRIIGGNVTAERPEIGQFGNGWLGWCTATLIHPQYILTANHCNYGFPVASQGAVFITGNGYREAVVELWVFGPEGRVDRPDGYYNMDVMIGRLRQPIPADIATPATIAGVVPQKGQVVTVFGYGCNAGDGSGAGVKRYAEFIYDPQITNTCSGDSGGPNVYGRLTEKGAIWAVNSFGETGADGTTHDVRGNVARLKEDIMEAIRIMAKSRFETGINRPGYDQTITTATTPEACERKCIDLSACRAWTLQGTLCYLKTVAPTWVPCADCTSGLRPVLERDVDRPGKDYRSFSLPEARAELCAAQCGMESACAAFTYNNQRCYLKSSISATKSLPYAISGMKWTFEIGYDRAGNNYAVRSASSSSGCLSICAKDSLCKAFSYVASSKRCWLKDAVPYPTRNTSVVSGVKRPLDLSSVQLLGIPIADKYAFEVDPPLPERCQAECAAHPDCLSFSYRRPLTGLKATCTLFSDFRGGAIGEWSHSSGYAGTIFWRGRIDQ